MPATVPSSTPSAVAPAPGTSVRAVVQDRYGDTDVVHLGTRTVPELGPHEVLVAVRAAAVDRGTWHLMLGEPLLVRLAFGLRRPRYAALGRDVAGVVLAVGAEVGACEVGDEILGIAPTGSLAEVAVVPDDRIVRKPAGLSFEAAAALPVSGLTALGGVVDVGRVRAGQRVLVIGASGGVGTYAVQIAAAAGAIVTGVCSAAKADLVRSLGATDVIDRATERLDARGGGYDLVLDLAGNRSLRELRRLLAPRGTLVVAGGDEGGRWLGGNDRQLRAALWSLVLRQRLTGLYSRERGADIQRLVEMVASGAVTPSIGGVYRLADAREALADLAAGRARGKLVVVP